MRIGALDVTATEKLFYHTEIMRPRLFFPDFLQRHQCPTAEYVELKSAILVRLIPAIKGTSQLLKNKDAFCCSKSKLLAKYLLALRSEQLVPMQAMMPCCSTLSKTT